MKSAHAPHESELPLAAPPTQAGALAIPADPTPGQLLKFLVESGNAEQQIGVLERLVALKERADDKAAEREFAAAFHALQQDIPGIEAIAEVPDKQGNVKYVFAPYEHIMREVRPFLMKHGFSVTFDSEFKDGRMVIRCTLMHVGGHSRTSTQFIREGRPFGANDAQADGATVTMGKRYALCQALNIVIERDTDARNEGQSISHEQAQTLRELVKETNSDEARFLKYAGAAKYEEIGANRYQELFRSLQDRLTRR